MIYRALRRSRRVTILLLATLLPTGVCFPETGTHITPSFPSAPIDSNSSGKQCFVWFEVNNSQHLRQYFLNGQKWLKVGRPVISARKGNVVEFTKEALSKHIPVITGFKTYEFFVSDSIYDPESWRKIALLARTLSQLTDGRPVILENEGAVKHLRKIGQQVIDYKKLYAAVAPHEWPEIWFWYAPIGNNEQIQSMSYNIAKAIIKGIEHASLIESNSAGYSRSKTTPSALNISRTRILTNDPISIIYLDDKRNRFWRYKHITQSVKKSIGKRIIFYPGFDDINRHSDAAAHLDERICTK